MFNTIAEFFKQYDKTVDLEEGHPVVGPIQYELTGEGGGKYFLSIVGNDVIVYEGTAMDPVSIIECPATDYLALKNKQTTQSALIKAGKLKISKGIKNVLHLTDYMVK